jgi:hypothetical protein
MDVDPFAQEIETLSNQIVFRCIGFARVLLNKAHYWPAVAWRRKAIARN